jgi:hypothetical protein
MESTLAIDSLSLTPHENENDGVDVAQLLDGVIEINDKPANLDEFQSYWIEMYLPSLYQTSVSVCSHTSVGYIDNLN